jgi:hypothetical protein
VSEVNVRHLFCNLSISFSDAKNPKAAAREKHTQKHSATPREAVRSRRTHHGCSFSQQFAADRRGTSTKAALQRAKWLVARVS